MTTTTGTRGGGRPGTWIVAIVTAAGLVGAAVVGVAALGNAEDRPCVIATIEPMERALLHGELAQAESRIVRYEEAAAYVVASPGWADRARRPRLVNWLRQALEQRHVEEGRRCALAQRLQTHTDCPWH